MLELEWIQLLMILQQPTLKMELDLKKIHWERSKQENEILIINNTMQIEMAKTVIVMCDKKIKYFEKLEAEEEKRHPKTADSSSEQAPIESEKSQ